MPDLSGDAAAGRRLILIGILVNAGLSAVKILAGLFGNSAALAAVAQQLVGMEDRVTPFPGQVERLRQEADELPAIMVASRKAAGG